MTFCHKGHRERSKIPLCTLPALWLSNTVLIYTCEVVPITKCVIALLEFMDWMNRIDRIWVGRTIL